jgi:hypothetical protein
MGNELVRRMGVEDIIVSWCGWAAPNMSSVEPAFFHIAKVLDNNSLVGHGSVAVRTSSKLVVKCTPDVQRQLCPSQPSSARSALACARVVPDLASDLKQSPMHKK